MNRTDLTDHDLGARIAAACEDRSERLAVGPRPFEPGAAPTTGLPLGPAGGRSRHRLVLVAAAVAVIGALIGAVALIGADGGPEVIRSATTAPTPTDPPLYPATAGQGWLAPAVAPLGLELQSVTWRDEPDRTGTLGQLFYPTEWEGAVLVLISPSSGEAEVTPDATVRGRPASVAPSKEDGDRSTTINWDEDVHVEARFIGMDLEHATTILDALRWRSSDHADGFDQLEGQDRPAFLMNDAAPSHSVRSAELVYADAATSAGPGVGTQVTVHTTRSRFPTMALLQSDFLDTDGGGTEGVRRSYDDEFGTLTTSWLDDGWNAAWIDANQTNVSEAQLRAVADSLVVTDEAGLRLLEHPTPDGDPAGVATTTTVPPALGTSTTTGPTTSGPEAGGVPPQNPFSTVLEQLDGTTVSLGELASGRPTLVVLWQTTCVPCIPTIAALDEQAWAHPDRAVVLVAVEDDFDQVRQFVDEHRVTLPVLLDEGGDLSRDWDASAVPTTVALTADGTRSRTFVGALDDGAAGQAFLDQFFAS